MLTLQNLPKMPPPLWHLPASQWGISEPFFRPPLLCRCSPAGGRGVFMFGPSLACLPLSPSLGSAAPCGLCLQRWWQVEAFLLLWDLLNLIAPIRLAHSLRVRSLPHESWKWLKSLFLFSRRCLHSKSVSLIYTLAPRPTPWLLPHFLGKCRFSPEFDELNDLSKIWGVSKRMSQNATNGLSPATFS